MKRKIKDLDVYEKRVLLRVDFNVPIKDGKIESDIRIVEELPTIKYLLAKRAKLIICSHLGRPDGKKIKEFSLKPVAEHLQKLLPNNPVKFIEESIGEFAQEESKKLKSGEILFLENLRFYAEEENNDVIFSRELSKLADIFVFDAFGTSHRKHASTFGVAKFLPSAMGFLMEKELKAFDEALEKPKRPLVAILGGAKVSDKLLMTENLIEKVDVLLIGGGMCFTFIKALGGKVGTSVVDDEKVKYCSDVIKKAMNKKVEIVLPIDFVCSKKIDDEKSVQIFNIGDIPKNYMGLDIGYKTVELFSKYIKKAKTIVWNGPMGVYEKDVFANGTKNLAKKIIENRKCFSIAGGGDLVNALEHFGLTKGFKHISTGGGASMKLLEGTPLSSVEVLSDK